MIDETTMGRGAIRIGFLHRWYRRHFKRRSFKKSGQGIGVDWTKGYDVRDQIGQITIKNQGTNDSCGGQSGAYFLEIQRKLQGKPEVISAKSIYAPAHADGGGMTISSLEEAICAHGANLESHVPSYDIYGNPLTETLMEECSWNTPTMQTDAETRAGYTPFNVKVDIDTVAGIIQQYGACIIEITGQNGHIPSWTSSTPTPPSSYNSNPFWNHYLCACGYIMMNGIKYITVLESEGTAWGINGIQYISERYFLSGYLNDAITFIHDDKLVPNSSSYSIWSALWLYFMMKWRFV